MQRAEVEQLLGGPAGDYRRHGTIYDAMAVLTPGWLDFDPREGLSVAGCDQWEGDAIMIAVEFDQSGGVKSAFGALPAAPLWYRALRCWVPLPDWNRTY
jgi:hypothetical protein